MKKYFLKEKKLLIISLVFIIISASIEVFLAFIIKMVADSSNSLDLNILFKNIVTALIFIVILYSIFGISEILKINFIKKSMQHLRNDIFNKIIKKNISDFNSQNSAKYISMLNNDMYLIENDFFVGVFEFIFNISRLLLGAIAIVYINKYIAISVFVIGSISVLLPTFLNKYLIPRKQNYSNSQFKFNTKIKDIFNGFETIKSYNIVNDIRNEFKHYNQNIENSKYKLNIFNLIITILSKLSGFLVFFTALSLGTYFVITKSMSFGSLLASIQLMNNIVSPMSMISPIMSKINSNKLIIKNILELSYEKNNDDGIYFNNFNKEIKFENVSFCYKKGIKVLNNINLILEKGKKYAIVGESGSGKSTLIKLILRYYNPSEGNIYIDDINLTKINYNSIYSLVSLLDQNIFLFDNTIKENITLFKKYDKSSIDDVIKLSGLKNTLNEYNKSLDYFVGENGKELSGGEKQRVGIARALITKKPILLLDEANSALDNITAYTIEKSILNVNDLTSIVITHKLNAELLKK